MSTLAFAALGSLVIVGLWIGVALGLVGMVFLYFGAGGEKSLAIATMAIWNILCNYSLIALPLYILLGEMFVHLGLSNKIYEVLTPLFERFPGKLLLSNVVICALFGAVCGSSMATAAMVGSVAYPTMVKKGYNKRTLIGNLAGSGTLGILVPPSIPIIVYCSITGVSVGASFIAALIPAAIVTLLFAVYVIVYCTVRPQVVPSGRGEEIVPLMRAIIDLKHIFPMVVLIVAVMGTIYLGLATPTESAGLGVTVVVIISLGYKTFSFKKIGNALIATALICATVGFVIMGAMVFSVALSTAGIPRAFVMALQSLNLSPVVMISMVYLLYIVLGCFMGATEMMVTTLPFTYPLVMSLGYDPYWFAIVLVLLVEIGLLTPPVGMNLFVLVGVTNGEMKLGEIARGSLPYILILTLGLVIISFFPQLCTFLTYRML